VEGTADGEEVKKFEAAADETPFPPTFPSLLLLLLLLYRCIETIIQLMKDMGMLVWFVCNFVY